MVLWVKRCVFKLSLSTVESQDDNDLLVNGDGVSPPTQWQSFTSLTRTHTHTHTRTHTHTQLQSLSVTQTRAYTNANTCYHPLFPPFLLSPLSFSQSQTHTFTKRLHLNTEFLLYCMLLCWEGGDQWAVCGVRWDKWRCPAVPSKDNCPFVCHHVRLSVRVKVIIT